MTGFAHVTRVLISRELFEAGHVILRQIGGAELEGLILWAGTCDGEEFSVRAVLRPVQKCTTDEHGLFVLVDGRELHRMGVWLHEHRMQLVAQVHTHPTEAYHSETDDAIPIVATAGGLSLVVPDFARGEPRLVGYASFRLDNTGKWCELSERAVAELIHIIGPSAD